MSRDPSRRRLLATIAGLGTAGCIGLGTEAENDNSPPGDESSPETVGRSRAVPAPDGVHLITFFSSDDWRAEWDNRLVPGFTDRSSVPVDVEFLSPEMGDRIHILFERGAHPEILHGLDRYRTRVVVDGRTVPVGGLVDDLEATNGPLLDRRSIEVDGRAHVVPHGIALEGVLNYRADVYDDLGLSVPGTWDELRRNARVIDESEAHDVRGFAVHATQLPSAARDFRNLLRTAGGSIWRWADGDRRWAELAFRDADVRATLQLQRDLAEYAPAPSEQTVVSTIRQWVRGDLGQCILPNAWLAGYTYAQDAPGSTAIALATDQAPLPKRERSLRPADRGRIRTSGALLGSGSSHPDAAREFLRFAYEGPARQARMNAVKPMRTLPPYEGLLDVDAYRRAPIFDVEDGHFLERNRHCLDNIAPHLSGVPRTTGTLHASRFGIVSELVHEVSGRGAPMDAAIDRARSRLRSRLVEGRS